MPSIIDVVAKNSRCNGKSKLIISLEKIREQDLPLVGSKAFGLTRMKQTGLLVPPGFCIKTTAFREHIETNNLAGKIEAALDNLNSDQLRALESKVFQLWDKCEECSVYYQCNYIAGLEDLWKKHFG